MKKDVDLHDNLSDIHVKLANALRESHPIHAVVWNLESKMVEKLCQKLGIGTVNSSQNMDKDSLRLENMVLLIDLFLMVLDVEDEDTLEL